MSLIDGFAVTVAIWPREVVSCRDFILHAVATFWAMSLFRNLPWQHLLKGHAPLIPSRYLQFHAIFVLHVVLVTQTEAEYH